MKNIVLPLAFLMSFSVNANAENSLNKFGVSVGSLPGVTGFKDAYLTDRIESGEGSTSEEVFMDYSDSNSGLINPALFLSFPLKVNGKDMRSVIDNTSAIAELGLSVGNATTVMLSGKFQHEFWQPTSSSSMTVTPLLGFAFITQDMGVVPNFPGEINTADGDFVPGSEIKMNLYSFVLGINVGLNYKFDSFSVFSNIGYQYSPYNKSEIIINDTELKTGKIHATNCTGASSVNLECSEYFDPFENVGGLTGVTFQLGAYF